MRIAGPFELTFKPNFSIFLRVNHCKFHRFFSIRAFQSARAHYHSKTTHRWIENERSNMCLFLASMLITHNHTPAVHVGQLREEKGKVVPSSFFERSSRSLSWLVGGSGGGGGEGQWGGARCNYIYGIGGQVERWFGAERRDKKIRVQMREIVMLKSKKYLLDLSQRKTTTYSIRTKAKQMP